MLSFEVIEIIKPVYSILKLKVYNQYESYCMIRQGMVDAFSDFSVNNFFEVGIRNNFSE